jgi:hypothetical protein
LLAPRPTPKLEDHPLSAVRDCLFNIFAATQDSLNIKLLKIEMSHLFQSVLFGSQIHVLVKSITVPDGKLKLLEWAV